MQWVRDFSPHPERERQYQLALGITIGGNILLAVAKGVVAWLTGSAAIYADAANSVSDVLYSLLMVIGLWMAERPPDISHPQGHSRFEPLVGLLVTGSMAFAGYEAVRTAITRLASGGASIEIGLPGLVLLGSAVAKAVMFYFINRIAHSVGSPALATTAKDNLADVLSSAAAFLGVLGSRYLSPLLDPAAGLLVAAWIFRAVYQAGRENLDYLTGHGASEDLRHEIVRVAEGVPGVQRVHYTMTEYVGPRLVVDLHINVDGNMTLNEAHTISDEVIHRLEAMREVDRAYVHIEPEGWD
ncbi:MAG TPA: cation diffusion facilitator family transporter [Anaerolineaceae bacterium]